MRPADADADAPAAAGRRRGGGGLLGGWFRRVAPTPVRLLPTLAAQEGDGRARQAHARPARMLTTLFVASAAIVALDVSVELFWFSVKGEGRAAIALNRTQRQQHSTTNRSSDHRNEMMMVVDDSASAVLPFPAFQVTPGGDAWNPEEQAREFAKQYAGHRLGPVVLIPTAGGNRLEARWDSSTWTSPAWWCSRGSSKYESLWMNSIAISNPLLATCWERRFRRAVEATADAATTKNLPGVDVRVPPGADPSSTVATLDPRLPWFSSYMAELLEVLSAAGLVRGSTLVAVPWDFRLAPATLDPCNDKEDSSSSSSSPDAVFPARFRTTVEAAVRAANGARAVVVCHGVGCLLARRRLACADPAWVAANVHALVAGASPWLGSSRALEALISGGSGGPFIGGLGDAPQPMFPSPASLRLRELQRTSELPYALIPMYNRTLACLGKDRHGACFDRSNLTSVLGDAGCETTTVCAPLLAAAANASSGLPARPVVPTACVHGTELLTPRLPLRFDVSKSVASPMVRGEPAMLLLLICSAASLLYFGTAAGGPTDGRGGFAKFTRRCLLLAASLSASSAVALTLVRFGGGDALTDIIVRMGAGGSAVTGAGSGGARRYWSPGWSAFGDGDGTVELESLGACADWSQQSVTVAGYDTLVKDGKQTSDASRSPSPLGGRWKAGTDYARVSVVGRTTTDVLDSLPFIASVLEASAVAGREAPEAAASV